MRSKKYVIYDNEYDTRVRLAYQRMACQAKFRGEAFTLTEADFRIFWHTPELFNRRGTRPTDLILTRIDHSGPWSRDNCHVVERAVQLARPHARPGRRKQQKEMV
jgi:hypothetical protein